MLVSLFHPFTIDNLHDKIPRIREAKRQDPHVLVKKRLLSPKNKDHQGTRTKMSRITRRKKRGVAQNAETKIGRAIASKVVTCKKVRLQGTREPKESLFAYYPVALPSSGCYGCQLVTWLGISAVYISYPTHAPKGRSSFSAPYAYS
jgi:hypothetical protein